MTSRRKLLLIGGATILFILLMSTFFGKKGLLEIKQARHRWVELQVEIGKLEKEKLRLEKEVEELKKNPQAVEEEARGKLWLIKPEEKVLILPKNKEGQTKNSDSIKN